MKIGVYISKLGVKPGVVSLKRLVSTNNTKLYSKHRQFLSLLNIRSFKNKICPKGKTIKQDNSIINKVSEMFDSSAEVYSIGDAV